MAFDFSTFPTLTTERLILRQVRESDIQAAKNLWGDPEVTKFLSDTDDINDVVQIQPILDWCIKLFNSKMGIRWAITLKSGGDEMIGTCGFHAYDANNRHTEIGYDLARAYWQQGIMTEALQAVVRFCFESLDVHRIEADVTAGNIASFATLHKLGFRIEGTWRERALKQGKFYDLWQFGLLRREWERENNIR